MAAHGESAVIKLESWDGRVYEVEERMAVLSETIKAAIAGNPNSFWSSCGTSAGGLEAVIREVCFGGVGAESFAEECRRDKDLLLQVLLGAYHLKIEPLYDLMCRTVADMINGKSPEEIRAMFGIEPDLTAEEIMQIHRQMPFLFTGPDPEPEPIRPTAESRGEEVEKRYLQYVAQKEAEFGPSWHLRFVERERKLLALQRFRERMTASFGPNWLQRFPEKKARLLAMVEAMDPNWRQQYRDEDALFLAMDPNWKQQDAPMTAATDPAST